MGDVDCRRQGRHPGEAAVAAAEVAQTAVSHNEVTNIQPRHRFAEGNDDRGALAHRQRRVVHHNGGCRTLGVDGVVVGVGGAAANVARCVGDPGIVQGDQVGGVTGVGGWRERRRPRDAAVAAADRAQGAVGNGQIGVAETAYRFTEGNGHQRGLTDFQRGIRHRNGRGRTLGINGVVVRVGGAAANVARCVGDPGIVQGDEVGGIGDVGGWRERRRPGDAAVAAADVAQRAIGHRQVGIGEVVHRFAEGDGHQRGLTDRKAGVRHDNGRRWAQRIDGVVVGVGGSHSRIARQVRHAAVIQGDEVAAVGHGAVRGQGRRPGEATVGTAQSAQYTVGHAEVRRGQPGHRFAEGDGDGRGFTRSERGIGHHNAGGWADGIDGVVVGVGGAGSAIARQVRHAAVIQGDEVAAVGHGSGRGQGRRPGDASVGAAQCAQYTVGDAEVSRGQPGHRFAEGDGDRRGFSGGQGRIGNDDGGRRKHGVDAHAAGTADVVECGHCIVAHGVLHGAAIGLDGAADADAVAVQLAAGDGQAEHQGAGAGAADVVGEHRAAAVQGDGDARGAADATDSHRFAEVDGEVEVLPGDVGAIGRHADAGDGGRDAIDQDVVLAGDGVRPADRGQGQDGNVVAGALDGRAVQGQGTGGLEVQVGADIPRLHCVAEGQDVAAGAGNVGGVPVHQAGFQQQGRGAAGDGHALVEGDGDGNDIAHLVAAVRGGGADVGDLGVDRADSDVDGVGIGLGAAAAGQAQVAGADLQAGWAVVAASGAEHQAVEGVVDIGDRAFEGEGRVAGAAADEEAQTRGAAQGDQAVARGQRHPQRARAGIHVADADQVAVAAAERQVGVLVGGLRGRDTVDRGVVDRRDHQGKGGRVGLAAAGARQARISASVAAIVDGDRQRHVGRGVAGGGEAQAAGGDEGVDVGDGAGQGEGAGTRAAHGDAAGAGGGQGAAAHAEGGSHAAGARVDIGEADAGQGGGHILGHRDGAGRGDAGGIVHRLDADRGRDADAGAVHAAITGAAVVSDAGQRYRTAAAGRRFTAVAVGHSVDDGLGAGRAEAGVGQGDGGGAATDADAVADTVAAGGAAGAVCEGDVGAVDAQDFAGAVGQVTHGQGQTGDGLARLDGADAHAAEQVHRRTVFGVGRRTAGGGQGGRVVHAGDADGDIGIAAGGTIAIVHGDAHGAGSGARIGGVAVAVGDVAHQRLDGRRGRIGVQADHQVVGAGAAGEAADHHAAEGDVRTGNTDLPCPAPLVDDGQDVFAAGAVGNDGDGDIAAIEVRGIAVGDRGIAAGVQQGRAVAFYDAHAIAVQVADHGRRVDRRGQGEVVTGAADVAGGQHGAVAAGGEGGPFRKAAVCTGHAVGCVVDDQGVAVAIAGHIAVGDRQGRSGNVDGAIHHHLVVLAAGGGAVDLDGQGAARVHLQVAVHRQGASAVARRQRPAALYGKGVGRAAGEEAAVTAQGGAGGHGHAGSGRQRAVHQQGAGVDVGGAGVVVGAAQGQRAGADLGQATDAGEVAGQGQGVGIADGAGSAERAPIGQGDAAAGHGEGAVVQVQVAAGEVAGGTDRQRTAARDLHRGGAGAVVAGQAERAAADLVEVAAAAELAGVGGGGIVATHAQGIGAEGHRARARERAQRERRRAGGQRRAGRHGDGAVAADRAAAAGRQSPGGHGGRTGVGVGAAQGEGAAAGLGDAAQVAGRDHAGIAGAGVVAAQGQAVGERDVAAAGQGADGLVAAGQGQGGPGCQGDGAGVADGAAAAQAQAAGGHRGGTAVVVAAAQGQSAGAGLGQAAGAGDAAAEGGIGRCAHRGARGQADRVVDGGCAGQGQGTAVQGEGPGGQLAVAADGQGAAGDGHAAAEAAGVAGARQRQRAGIGLVQAGRAAQRAAEGQGSGAGGADIGIAGQGDIAAQGRGAGIQVEGTVVDGADLLAGAADGEGLADGQATGDAHGGAAADGGGAGEGAEGVGVVGDQGAGRNVGGAGVGVVAIDLQDRLTILDQGTAAGDHAGQGELGRPGATAHVDAATRCADGDGVVDGEPSGVVGKGPAVQRQGAGGQMIVVVHLQSAATDRDAAGHVGFVADTGQGERAAARLFQRPATGQRAANGHSARRVGECQRGAATQGDGGAAVDNEARGRIGVEG